LVIITIITMKVIVDDLGRILLRKKLREKYGREFILFDKQGEIVLHPLKIDITDLSEKLEKFSISELKEIAEKEAIKEIGEKIKRK